MRRMTKRLADGNAYTFQTLTRLELSSYQDIFRNKSAKVMNGYQKKLDDGGELSEDEYEQYVKLQNERMSQVNNLIRISLSAKHPEFKLTNDENQEKILNKKLESLIDMRDTGQIVEFITTGTVTQIKETIMKEEDIVL